MRTAIKTIAAAAFGCVVATAASAEMRRLGTVTVYTPPANSVQQELDFANAEEMPLPMNPRAPMAQSDAMRLGPAAARKPTVWSGMPGSGEANPVQLTPPRADEDDDEVAPAEYGSSNHVFTSSRVNARRKKTVQDYPFSATGKLFFKIGTGTFVCSASLIKRGVILTAAHCVSEFGANQLYSDWQFIPAWNEGAGKFGTWTTQQVLVLTSYLNGTDSCAVAGIVCQNDVALLIATPQNGTYPGDLAGTYGFGVDGFGFNPSNLALINQLGYPVALDKGDLMQRNDSQGFVDPTQSNNTVIGSLLTGGSSGGPWLVNLGMPPKLNGTSFGQEATHNVVVGVTSWGYVNTGVKEQGASPFTAANVQTLLFQACFFYTPC